jgi:hypothetical protein
LHKDISLAACLGALIFALAGSFVGPARAQAGGEPVLTGVPEDSFVIYQNEQGETACRAATPAERERIRANHTSSTAALPSGAKSPSTATTFSNTIPRRTRRGSRCSRRRG